MVLSTYIEQIRLTHQPQPSILCRLPLLLHTYIHLFPTRALARIYRLGARYKRRRVIEPKDDQARFGPDDTSSLPLFHLLPSRHSPPTRRASPGALEGYREGIRDTRANRLGTLDEGHSGSRTVSLVLIDHRLPSLTAACYHPCDKSVKWWTGEAAAMHARDPPSGVHDVERSTDRGPRIMGLSFLYAASSTRRRSPGPSVRRKCRGMRGRGGASSGP